MRGFLSIFSAGWGLRHSDFETRWPNAMEPPGPRQQQHNNQTMDERVEAQVARGDCMGGHSDLPFLPCCYYAKKGLFWVGCLSWKCRRFRCRPQLVLKTCLRVFPTRRPNTADVSATSCDVGFFFSVSYVVSLPNCRHVVVVNRTHQP